MIYSSLPRKYMAIAAIRSQPFYGFDNRDFVIVYIDSHAYWVVGTRQEAAAVLTRCAGEVIEMEEKLPFLKYSLCNNRYSIY